MSIVIDLLLIAIGIFFIVLFTKNGFATTTTKIGKAWETLFTTLVLSPWVANLFEKWVLLNPLTKGIQSALNAAVNNNPNGYSLHELFEHLPEGLRHLLESNGLGIGTLEAKYGTQATTEILHAIAEGVATPIAHIAASFLSMITTALVCYFFFRWLEIKTQQRKISFFRVMDHVTGFIVGTAIGYFVITILSLVLHTSFQVVVALDSTSNILDLYQKSYVFKFATEFDLWETVKGIWNLVFA